VIREPIAWVGTLQGPRRFRSGQARFDRTVIARMENPGLRTRKSAVRTLDYGNWTQSGKEAAQVATGFIHAQAASLGTSGAAGRVSGDEPGIGTGMPRLVIACSSRGQPPLLVDPDSGLQHDQHDAGWILAPIVRTLRGGLGHEGGGVVVWRSFWQLSQRLASGPHYTSPGIDRKCHSGSGFGLQQGDSSSCRVGSVGPTFWVRRIPGGSIGRGR
jgi:hypothetical protein